MNMNHTIMALDVLNKWYGFAEHSLSLIDKHKVTHPSLQESKRKIDGECRRNALKCKTRGLIYHDQFKRIGEFK